MHVGAPTYTYRVVRLAPPRPCLSLLSMMLPARSARPFLTVRLCCRSMCSANSASLLHREVLEVDAAAAPKATCWIMHGILGSGRNLRTFGRRIARTYPGWEVSLIDHRGHGKSPSFNAPHTIEACVNDIQALAVACGKAPNVLIGHSVGGKVALAALDRGMIQGSDVPRHTFVLDALPGVVPTTTKFSSSMNVSGVVSALASLTPMMPAPSKAAALDGLRAAGMEEAVVSWMSTNLTHVQNKGYDWTFDLDVIVPSALVRLWMKRVHLVRACQQVDQPLYSYSS